MANINLTASTSNISVTSTPANITVTEQGGGATFNVTTSTNNITVGSTPVNVTVSAGAVVSNSSVRTKLGVQNVSGFGTLAYDNSVTSNGIIQYTGVSNAEIISVADAWIGTKDTDDLPEGTTNLYLNGAGTTDDLTEGTGNLWFTTDRANSAITNFNGDIGQSTGGSGSGILTSVVAQSGLFGDVQLSSTYGKVGTPGGTLSTTGAITGDVELTVGDTGLSSANAATVFFGTTDGSATLTKGYIRHNRDSSDPKFTFCPDTRNEAGNVFLLPTNTDDLLESASNLYFTYDRANTWLALNNHVIGANATIGANTTFTGDIDVQGNVDVQGNLNYINVVDLLVNDQSITLNYGNATARDAFIIVDRSGTGGGTNVALKWNETSNAWEFTNDGSTYYPIPTNTGDLQEGINLYYTSGRFDGDFNAKTTDDLTEGSTNLYFNGKTTDGLPEGSANLYYTTDRANSAIGAYQGNISTAGDITANDITGVDGLFDTITANTIIGSGYFDAVDTGDTTTGRPVYYTGENYNGLPQVKEHANSTTRTKHVAGFAGAVIDAEDYTKRIVTEGNISGVSTQEITTSNFLNTVAWSPEGDIDTIDNVNFSDDQSWGGYETQWEVVGVNSKCQIWYVPDITLSNLQSRLDSGQATQIVNLWAGMWDSTHIQNDGTNLYAFENMIFVCSDGNTYESNITSSGYTGLGYNTFTVGSNITFGSNVYIPNTPPVVPLDDNTNYIVAGSPNRGTFIVDYFPNSNVAITPTRTGTSNVNFDWDTVANTNLPLESEATGIIFQLKTNLDSSKKYPYAAVKTQTLNDTYKGQPGDPVAVTINGSNNVEYVYNPTRIANLTTDYKIIGTVRAGSTDANSNGVIEITDFNTDASSDDILEGTTQQFFTSARANTAIDNYLTGGYGITYSGGTIEVTNSEIQAQANVAFGNNTTDNLTEGATNLYFTYDNANTWLATKDTDDLTEGSTNLYYSNALVGAYLPTYTGNLDSVGNLTVSGIIKTDDLQPVGGDPIAITSARVDDLQISQLGGSFGYAFGQGTSSANDFLIADGTGVFSPTAANTSIISEGTNLYYTTDRANAAIGAYQGDINTAGNITGNYVFATTRFEGDINGAIQAEVWNASGATLNKGDIVALNGAAHGDTPDVVLADASNASLMPGFGVVKNSISPTATGEVVISGKMNFAGHGFTIGAQLYVNGVGQFTETVPEGEGNLVQKIATVTNSNTINVAGAGRTNATPNLDEGNIFLGSTSNTAVTVAPSTNFATTGNAFELSNSLSNVNNISTETDTNFTVKQNFNGTYSSTLEVDGDGYAFRNNNLYTNSLNKTGTNVIQAYKITGNIVTGNTDIVISSVNRYHDDAAASVSDLSVGMSYGYGTSITADPIGFPQYAYITSVDAANNKVTMSEPAQANLSLPSSGVWEALVDTTRNQVVRLQSELDAGQGSSNSTLATYSLTVAPTFILNDDAYGYPSTGFEMTAFDVLSSGVSGDYNWNANIADFMVGKTQITPNDTAIKAHGGIVIGANTSLTNRAEFDSLESIGINSLWDGVDSTGYNNKINQFLLKQYSDNSALTNFSSGSGGPRIFFSSASGKQTDYAYDTYPREGQELGRLTWWGTNAQSLTQSTFRPPALLTVQAATDWTTAGQVAGNTNMYLGATSNHANGADLFLAYKAGELILASPGGTGQGVTFAPSKINGNTPDTVYDGSKTTWANISYANVSASSGAKVTVTNGASSGAGTVGDMQISLDRLDNSGNIVHVNGFTDFNFCEAGLFGGFPADGLKIGQGAQGSQFLSGLSDGDPILIDNYTGQAGTDYNGTVKYAKYYTFASVYYFILLYDNPGLTTPSISGNAYYSSNFGSAGSVEYTLSSGVTAREWTLNLAEQSDDLVVSTNGTTHTTFYSNGNLQIAGDLVVGDYAFPTADGTSGQVIQTDGNGTLTFANVSGGGGSGTVTSVDSGAGLTGGPITTSGTLAVGAGTGITVNADDVAINYGVDHTFTANVEASNFIATTGIKTDVINPYTAFGTITFASPRMTDVKIGNNFYPDGSASDYDVLVLYANNIAQYESISTPIENTDVKLKQFSETTVTTANVSGATTFDVSTGSIFKANVTGDITSLALTNAVAGTSATLILTQGATTGTLTAGASWLWAGGTKTLSNTTGDVDVISVVYDGTNYYASLTTGYVT